MLRAVIEYPDASVHRIALRLGCTWEYVRSVLERHRIDWRSRSPSGSRRARDKRIRELVEKGWSYGQVGEVYGLTKQRVHQIVTRPKARE